MAGGEGKSRAVLPVSPTLPGAFCPSNAPQVHSHAVQTVLSLCTAPLILYTLSSGYLQSLEFTLEFSDIPVLRLDRTYRLSRQKLLLLPRDKAYARCETQKRTVLTRSSHQLEDRCTHCEHICNNSE